MQAKENLITSVKQKFEISLDDYNRLNFLINSFESYYESEEPWSFQELENQRQIAFELIGIMKKFK